MDTVQIKIEETAASESQQNSGQINERRLQDNEEAALLSNGLVQQRFNNTVLNSSNCLSLWALAKQYDFDAGLARLLAFEHFLDVVSGNEFKYMEVELLSEFLSSNKVNVDSEEDVFRALVIWMEFDLLNRLPHVQRLIQTIRVGQLNRSVCN